MKPTRFRSQKTSLRSVHVPRAVSYTAIFVFCLLLAVHLIDVNLRPMVTTASRSAAVRVAVEALNSALTEELARTVGYEDVVEIERSKSGTFRSARFNFAAVTKLQSEATSHAEENLKTLENTTLRLPIAPMLGQSLFANLTPKIPVRIVIMGAMHSSVIPEVKSVGINQTVHILYLDLSADVNVVAPFVSTPTTVHSRIPIAYLVLSGEVPQVVWGQQYPSLQNGHS